VNIGWKLGAVAALALSVLLLIALFIIGGQRNEARRDRDAATQRVAVLTADLSTCRNSVATLGEAVKNQGQSIQNAEAVATLERDLGQSRVAAAQATSKKLQGDVAYLQKLLKGADAPKSCQEGLNAIRANRR